MQKKEGEGSKGIIARQESTWCRCRCN